jgi:hypothetical protein
MEHYGKKGPPGEEFEGRNALAVALYPRGSAEPSAIAGDNWSPQLVDRWETWVAYHRLDLIPDGLGYEIRRLAAEVSALSIGRDDIARLTENELDRIVGKKRSGHGVAGIDRLVRDAIVSAGGTTPATLNRLASELIIAREVATAADIAFGRPLPGGAPNRGFQARTEAASA